MPTARKKPRMRLEFDTKVGPATFVGILSILSTFIGIGVLYGTISGQVGAASTNAVEAKTAVVNVERESKKRDAKIAEQSERIGRIETSVQFLVPAIQRIEAAIAK